MESQAIIYQQALDSKKTSEFYDKITCDFIIKYGNTETFEAEPEEEPPTPSDDVILSEYLDEDIAAAAKSFSKLCTVSDMTMYIPQSLLPANIVILFAVDVTKVKCI